MLEFPLVTKYVNQARQDYIGSVLAERFGALPPDVESSLRTVTDPQQLKGLLAWAVRCPDLAAFRARLSS